jgi:hypothetical protein
MKPVQPVIVLVIALVVGSAAGYGGYYYRGTTLPPRGNFAAGTRGTGAQTTGARGMMNGGRVNGQIILADSTSITVKLADGSSKIILLSGQTTINKATQGSKTDLTSGTTVSVFGSTNSDGSVTAQNIQINQVSPTPAPTK